MRKTILILILILSQLALYSQYSNSEIIAVPFKDGNKWGWADVYSGSIMIEPIYDSVKYDLDKEAYLIFTNDKMGLLKHVPEKRVFVEVVPAIYDDIVAHQYGYITMLINKKGFINLQSEVILENSYDRIYINYPFALISDIGNFKSGVYDLKNKKQLLDLNYDYLSNFTWTNTFDFKEDLLIKNKLFVNENEKYFYLDTNGNLKEVRAGIDFNMIAHTRPTIYEKREERIFQILTASYFYSISSDKSLSEKFIRVKLKKYFNTDKHFNKSLIIGNKKATKFGILNTSKNSIVLKPQFEKINILENINSLYFPYHFMIAIKGNKQIIVYNNKRLFEDEYDEIMIISHAPSNSSSRYIMLKNNNLYGFAFISEGHDKKAFYKNKEDLDLILIEPKYRKIEYSIEYSNSSANILVFEVTDTNGETYFINSNGVEFKR